MMLAFTILHTTVEFHTKRALCYGLFSSPTLNRPSVFFRSGRSSSSLTQKFPGPIPRIECLMSIETRSYRRSNAEKSGTGLFD